MLGNTFIHHVSQFFNKSNALFCIKQEVDLRIFVVFSYEDTATKLFCEVMSDLIN